MKTDEYLRKAHRAGYQGNLAFADHCIGHMIGQLEQKGLLENTIIVYTSDHGEMDGDHGLFHKFCLFDPSGKVPLIISRPGVKIPRLPGRDVLGFAFCNKILNKSGFL